ncbi:putative UPF0481 protein [Tanacetum coccineum]
MNASECVSKGCALECTLPSRTFKVTDFQSLEMNASFGLLIASSSLDKTVRVWDIPNGLCIRVIYGVTSQLCIRFHPVMAVPECFVGENPEPYKPQKLGLGPFHHFRDEVYKMEWDKVSANQIPFEVLRELQTCLHVFVNEGEDDDSLSNKLVQFCEGVSPLKLANESQICGGASRQLHLLDLLYELIVNKVSNEQGNHEMLSRKKKVACINDIKASVREKKEEERAEDEKINAKETRIPSVSLLHDVMNVEFKVAAGGISSIEFSKEHLIFYLPAIIVNENTEVILRNLVAYEAIRMKKSGDILQFAEYVDLMCGIIDKPRDVELLRKRNIVEVQDDMDDEEIANLFNGIKKFHFGQEERAWT